MVLIVYWKVNIKKIQENSNITTYNMTEGHTDTLVYRVVMQLKKERKCRSTISWLLVSVFFLLWQKKKTIF